jgi:hypothetical protein
MNTGICTIARLENKYIRDWVSYHLAIGFDHITLYDNNHEGEDNFYDAIPEYIDNGLVDILNVRDKKNIQNACYNEYIEKYAPSYDWNAIIDADEYITLNNKFHNVKEWLSQEKFNDADTIHINWMIYCDGNIHADYSKPLPLRCRPYNLDTCDTYNFPENFHIKTLVNGKSQLLGVSKFLNPHFIAMPSNSICYDDCGDKIENNSPFHSYSFKECWIRHFNMKSLEEFIAYKVKRGFPDGAPANSVERWFKINGKTEEGIELYKKMCEK